MRGFPRSRVATCVPFPAGHRWRRLVRSGVAAVFLALLGGCGKPAYPDEQAVRERFQVDYREANCELIRIHRPEAQADQASLPFVYVHIRFEARCKDLRGETVLLVRQQVWQRGRERPTLFQGAWRWSRAGEISG